MRGLVMFLTAVCLLFLLNIKTFYKLILFKIKILFFLLTANETHLNLDNLLYNVDSEGSTLLHLAVDSGIVAVSVLYLSAICK